MGRAASGKGGSAEERLRSLHEEPLRPFYVLFGQERYFIRKGLRLLKERVIPTRDLAEMLYRPVYGGEAKGLEIDDLVRTQPFFEGTQLVVVWDGEKLGESDQRVLLAYARDPAPFTCLVLVGGGSAPKGSLFSYLREHYPEGWLEFPALSRSELLRWAGRLAEEKGLGRGLGLDLLDGTLSSVRVPLESLEKRIEVLALHAWDPGDGSSTQVPSSPPAEVPLNQFYLLADPLLRGEVHQVLEFLDRFLGQGVHPLAVLSRIAWEVRKLWRLKGRMEQGAVDEPFLRSLRIPTFKKGLYRSALNRLSRADLREMLFWVGEADRLLKSSRIDPQLHLETLCLRITARTAGPSGTKGCD